MKTTPLVALTLAIAVATAHAQTYTGPDATVTLTPLEQQQIKDVCGIAMATSAANTEQRFGIATACVSLKVKIEAAAADEAKRKTAVNPEPPVNGKNAQAQHDQH